jgi:hypothetical protein
MGRTMSGVVVARDFMPPPGAPPKYWCYLTVDADTGERVKIRLHQSRADVAVVGDRVRFTRPARGNKRVKDVARI